MEKFDLDRFKKAQARYYQTALSEMKNGRKESHWIWFIFPQLVELGYSETAKFYGINGLEEAKAYMSDELLKNHLLEISKALLNIESNDVSVVMGYPDDLKLKSCMTLFSVAAPETEVFKEVLNKFYQGEMDKNTLNLLER